MLTTTSESGTSETRHPHIKSGRHGLIDRTANAREKSQTDPVPDSVGKSVAVSEPEPLVVLHSDQYRSSSKDNCVVTWHMPTMDHPKISYALTQNHA